ncbi:Sodium/potassium-transporting ATPase subunit beta-1 [Bienertia sinuspersici]
MEGKYGKILAKAEEYLHKHHGKSSDSSSLHKNVSKDEEGGSSYKAYLKKAKEFMHKKDSQNQQVDGANDNSDDKKKQYLGIAAGLWTARKMHKKKKKRRGGSKEKGGEEEGEGEGEESEEEEEEEEEEGGWFSQFVQGLQEVLGDD